MRRDGTSFGTRLRRISTLLLRDVDTAYEERGIDFRTRFFPIIYALSEGQSLTLSELTTISGFSQPATSKTVKQLLNDGLLRSKVGDDARVRRLSLSSKGQLMVTRLKPFWSDVKSAVEELASETTPNIFDALDSLETQLSHRSLLERLQENPKGTVTITPFTVQDRQAFKTLNLEWLHAYFEVEPRDLEVLDYPENILDAGGEIYFAKRGDETIGTGALIRTGKDEFQVGKMAVSESARGAGVGRKLCSKLIDRFYDRGGKRLTLQSNDTLKAAVHLYESLGFEHYTPDKPAEYKRTNVHMVLK